MGNALLNAGAHGLEKDFGFPGARVPSRCEPPSKGVGNQTQVFPQEEYGFLIAEPFHQSQSFHFSEIRHLGQKIHITSYDMSDGELILWLIRVALNDYKVLIIISEKRI